MALRLSSTSGLRNLLSSAVEVQSGSGVDADAVEEWTTFSSSEDGDQVPYHVVRSAFLAVQHGPPKASINSSLTISQSSALAHLDGCEVILPKPPERKRSPEFEAHLARLREAEERRCYSQLVKDVTRPGQDDLSGTAEETRNDGPFSSFRQQMGFGLHVAAIMFTGYVAGQYLFGRLFPHQPYMPPVGGALGLTVGMLVEVLLFIIQMSRLEDGNERRRKSRAREGHSRTAEEFQSEGTDNVISAEITENVTTSLRRRHRK